MTGVEQNEGQTLIEDASTEEKDAMLALFRKLIR
jgi:hypothetical protein